MVDTAWIGIVGTTLGAVIGVGGSLLTQGRAERSRTRREDERQWLADRREAYAALLDALRAWEQAAAEHESGDVVVDSEAMQVAIAKMWRLRREFVRATQTIQLLAPDSVRRAAQDAQAVTEDWLSDIVLGSVSADQITAERQVADKARRELVAAMRADLGVADPAHSQARGST